MIVVFGSRLYGKIDQCGPTFVATRFGHIYWLPLIPLGSHLVLEEYGDGSFRSVPAGLDLRSTFAGYARTWGILGALALVALAGAAMLDEDLVGAALMGLGAVAAFAAAIVAFVTVGKLGLDAVAQRMVYMDFAGHPVDVASLGDGRDPLRRQLYQYVVQRAQGALAAGYRAHLDPGTQWAQIAADPSVADTQLMAAAMTLARIEWSLAAGAARAQWEAAHAAIWSKLRQCEPRLLETARMQQAA